MGRVIRAQRRGAPGGVKGRTNTTHRVGPVRLRKLDYAEREGYVRAKIADIVHDPGRGAPVIKVTFRNAYHDRKDEDIMMAPEGVYAGQFLYMGTKAQLAIGNVLPVGKMPEGAICCQVERYPGDRGKLAKTSGEYVTVVGHNEEAGITKIRLPSGSKKNISSDCRGMVGLVAGGGRTEKPMLKAGRAHHKYKAKRNEWPKVRGVAMNPVDHPHGGGNHQHLGMPGTRSRQAPPGQKVGLIAARRTGRVRGRGAVKGGDE